MRPMLPIHILAGGLALVFGYTALYAAKGGALHRRGGMLFVYAMLAMAATGVALSIVRRAGLVVNLPAGLLTATLVVTSLATVRPAASTPRWLAIGGMLVFLAIALTMLPLGVQAIASGGKRHGIPAFPFFLFGVAGLLASAGDLRVLRSGPRQGGARLARHLWRMCFALFVASMSFVVQLPKFLPKSFGPRGLLMLPVLALVLTMFYWLWRLRGRGRPESARLRGMLVEARP